MKHTTKKMMAVVGLIAGSQFAVANANADGFVCLNDSGDLKIKVYNHVQPEVGTRTAAVMIVSDPTIADGRKTIATFKDSTSLLASSGTNYVANVDLRFSDSSRKGENIGGTKLGELDQIIMDVDFTYGDNLADSDEVEGWARLYKRNGDVIRHEMHCTRYLKN